MKTTKGGFTRAPVQIGGYTIYSVSNGDAIATALERGRDPRMIEANASLIAAAFNAATEIEDVGYDGLEAMRALVKMIELLVVIRHDSSGLRDFLREPVSALLDRLKGRSDET